MFPLCRPSSVVITCVNAPVAARAARSAFIEPEPSIAKSMSTAWQPSVGPVGTSGADTSRMRPPLDPLDPFVELVIGSSVVLDVVFVVLLGEVELGSGSVALVSMTRQVPSTHESPGSQLPPNVQEQSRPPTGQSPLVPASHATREVSDHSAIERRAMDRWYPARLRGVQARWCSRGSAQRRLEPEGLGSEVPALELRR